MTEEGNNMVIIDYEKEVSLRPSREIKAENSIYGTEVAAKMKSILKKKDESILNRTPRISRVDYSYSYNNNNIPDYWKLYELNDFIKTISSKKPRVITQSDFNDFVYEMERELYYNDKEESQSDEDMN